MNISQMRKLTALGVKSGSGGPVEARLKTYSTSIGLEVQALQGLFVACDAAEADPEFLDELLEEIDQRRQVQERCSRVLRDIAAQLDARAAGKVARP